MRSPAFSRFDRDMVYYRERPARRIAERFSLLFLLSLAAFATLTKAPAGDGEVDASPIVAATSVLPPSGAR